MTAAIYFQSKLNCTVGFTFSDHFGTVLDGWCRYHAFMYSDTVSPFDP